MSGFNPGKPSIGNQVLTWDGTKYVWQGPVVVYNAPAPGDWRRMIDRQANNRRVMSFDLVLKETSVVGGLDALKPRDMVFFGGGGAFAGNNNERYNRLAVLCQDATNTVLFVDSTLTGIVSNTGTLSGTAAGWKWIMNSHYPFDTGGGGRCNYLWAYNDIDGTLVRFKDNQQGGVTSPGLSVLNTYTIGTGGCRPLFDGTSIWCTGGGNLYRISDPVPVFGAGSPVVNTIETGGYTSTGLMAIDIGGGIYVYRPSTGHIIRVGTSNPYPIARFDVSSFSPPSSAGLACDGQNLWLNTSTGLAKFATSTMVNTATVNHPTLIPNGGLACNGASLIAPVPSSPTNNVIFTDLDATFTTALPTGGPQTSLQQAVLVSSVTGATDISYPCVVPNSQGVAEYYFICYNATPNNNASIRAFRYNPDMAVASLSLEGGLSFTENLITSATGSSPFQLHVDQHMTMVDLSGFGAGITLTLPPRPTRAVQMVIKDVSGAANTKNITINTSDSTNIDSAATNVINTAYGFRRLQYSPNTTFGAAGKWFVIGSG